MAKESGGTFETGTAKTHNSPVKRGGDKSVGSIIL